MADKDDDAVDLGANPPHDPDATPRLGKKVEDATGNYALTRETVKAAQDTNTGGIVLSKKHPPSDDKPEDYPNEDHWTAINTTIPENQNPEVLLDRVIRYVERYNHARVDGTTVATAAIVDEKVYTSNLGDATVIAFIHNPNLDDPNPDNHDKIKAIQITRNHVVSDQQERDDMPDKSKLITLGGHHRYKNKDETGNTNLSRTIGDSNYDLIRIPENRSLDLKSYLDQGMNIYVVAGSDGIMERTTLEDMEQLVRKTIKTARKSTGQMPSLKEIAIHLIEWRHKNGKIEHYTCNDDATVVVQEVKREPASSQQFGKKNVKLITIADGHGYNPDHGYDSILADIVAGEVPLFFEHPNLMHDAVMSRDKTNKT